MKEIQTQRWLQEIYKHPRLYEGKVVAILDDAQIVAVAESFMEAKKRGKEKAASSASTERPGKITLFSVPRNFRQVRILPLQ